MNSLQHQAPRVFSRANRGFTLLEVVIAVAILSLLSGTIYAVISGCIQIAVQAQTVEKDKARMEHFTSLLRRSIMSMPDGAKLKLELLDGANSIQQEFSLEGSADFFPFGERAISRSKTIFSLQPSPAGNADDGTPRYALAMWRSDMIQADKEDDDGETAQEVRPSHLVADAKGRYWLPLIDNISSWEWGFWDSENEKWEQEWKEDEEENPPLIELKVTLGGQTLPERNVFTVYQMPKITVPKPAEDPREAQDDEQMLAGNNANGNGGGNANNPNGGGGNGRNGNRPGRGNNGNGDNGSMDGGVPEPPSGLPPGFNGGPPGQGGGGGNNQPGNGGAGRGGGFGNGNGGGFGNGGGNRGGGGNVLVR